MNLADFELPMGRTWTCKSPFLIKSSVFTDTRVIYNAQNAPVEIENCGTVIVHVTRSHCFTFPFIAVLHLERSSSSTQIFRSRLHPSVTCRLWTASCWVKNLIQHIKQTNKFITIKYQLNIPQYELHIDTAAFKGVFKVPRAKKVETLWPYLSVPFWFVFDRTWQKRRAKVW